MQITLTPRDPEQALQVRALEARALELGVSVADLYAPWTVDQVGTAVLRQPLTEATVQAAEARAQAAETERARIEAEKLAITTQE